MYGFDMAWTAYDWLKSSLDRVGRISRADVAGLQAEDRREMAALGIIDADTGKVDEKRFAMACKLRDGLAKYHCPNLSTDMMRRALDLWPTIDTKDETALLRAVLVEVCGQTIPPDIEVTAIVRTTTWNEQNDPYLERHHGAELPDSLGRSPSHPQLAAEG